MTQQPTRHADTIIFPASLDPRAVSVVRRLSEAGHESYLVGGCVRDLLLGHIPKDFDVSTEARPRQIRRLFRNCRIIGRRFKLAHVHFGETIIEVATFRRNPSQEGGEDDEETSSSGEDCDDLLITRDNVYGNAEEDTVRRDFTINALLYDVGAEEVIDYVGGVEDLEKRVLRTIGEPDVRLAEDPVRMLRAVKFTSRLGLNLHEDLDRAMHEAAPLIARSAPPRVLEEIYKLMACGGAERALGMLLDFRLMDELLPEISDHWHERSERLLALGRAVDTIDRGRRTLSNAFLLALLFHDPWRERVDAGGGDPLHEARELMASAALRMSIPRRDVAVARQLLLTQLRLERKKRGRRFRMNDFLARPSTVEAIDMLYARALAGCAEVELHARWAQRLAIAHGYETEKPEDSREAQDEDRPRRRRRRRNRGRRSRGGRSRSRSETREEGADETRDAPRRDAPDRGARAEEREAPAPEPSPRDAPPAEAAAEAPAEAEHSSRGRGDGDAGDEHPPGASPPEAAPPVDEATERGKGGVGGMMRSLVRRVWGRQEASARTSPGATGEPHDSGATAGAPGGDPASAEADAAPIPGAGSRADEDRETDRGGFRPHDPDAEGTDARADTPRTDTPGASEHSTDTASDEATPDGADGDQPDGERRRPRRRRRRRSRRRSESASPAADQAAPAEGEDKDGDAPAEGSERSDDKTSDEEPSREGSSRSGRRGSRKRRRGSRSRGGSRSGSGSGSSSGSGARSSGSRDGEGGSGRSGGGRRKSSSSSRGRSSGPEDEGARKEESESTPFQRNPEDVEDLFDW